MEKLTSAFTSAMWRAAVSKEAPYFGRRRPDFAAWRGGAVLTEAGALGPGVEIEGN